MPSWKNQLPLLLLRFVDDKLTVVVLTNQREAHQMDIAQGVAAFYIPGLKLGATKD